MAKKSMVLGLALVMMVALVAAGCGGQKAEQYPSKPITYVVQASAGGSSDNFVRQIVKLLTEKKLVPVNVVVENRPGSSGAVAYTHVAKQKGDPYVIANTTSLFVTTAVTTGQYKLEDFTPIARLVTEANVVVARPEFKSIEDLLAAARSNPGGIKWSGGNVGGDNHLLAVMLEKAAQVKFTYVPFNADSEAVAALLGGHVQVASADARGVLEHHQAGTLRIVAIAGEQRLPILPDVPTLRELGYDVSLPEARGVIAPRDIPEQARAYLEETFRKLTELPEWKQYMEDNGMIPGFMGSAEFGEFLQQYYEIKKDILTELGLVK